MTDSARTSKRVKGVLLHLTREGGCNGLHLKEPPRHFPASVVGIVALVLLTQTGRYFLGMAFGGLVVLGVIGNFLTTCSLPGVNPYAQ